VRTKTRAGAWLLSLVLAASGVACVSTPGAGGGGQTAGDTCFDIRRVATFTPLHSMFVYVALQDGKQYVLTLDSIYPSLPYAVGITLSGSFHQVCSDVRASLTFREFGRLVRCRVVRVDEVANKLAAQELVQERTSKQP